MKILTVEDDHLSRVLLTGTLQSMGHEVTTCGTGSEAWSFLGMDKFDVVVSDWRLPGIDGLELCRRVRARERDAYLYFILVTGAGATAENEGAAIEAGVDDFLPKPVVTCDLRNRLRVAQRFLDYTRRVRQLESFLPICGYCKNIRNDRNYWQQIEQYIAERTGASFSHGICPDCYQRHVVPQLESLEGGPSAPPA